MPARRNQHTSIHFDTHLVNCPGKTNGVEEGNEDDDGNDMEPVDEACCEAVAVADEVESLRPPLSPPPPSIPLDSCALQCLHCGMYHFAPQQFLSAPSLFHLART